MDKAEEFSKGMGMKVVTVIRYLGGLIGDRKAEDTWMIDKVEGWLELVRTLFGFARKHLQSAYSGLQKSLQQDW